jgi:isocitrate lyase
LATLMMGAMMNYDLEAARLKKDWAENSRWKGIKRGYAAEEVVRLRGSVHIEHTLARRGAEKLWKLVNEEPFVSTLGAMTGNQAMQQVKAGLKAIYLSGWQVAADANVAGEMYPDQSLYPVNSVPAVVRRINSVRIRFSTWRARATSTSSLRSSPTPRLGSAECSMPSS